MNIWFFPTANVLVNTLLRSLVLIALMVFGVGTTFYSAYWGAIVHDTISLILLYPYV